MAKDRFQTAYSQGTLVNAKVIIDTETGVNYLWHHDGYAGGMTVLLDKEGKPVVTPVADK